jgi:hypothetical protein
MTSRQEGMTLGPYRIVEQVGLGGMATVYKAYQPSMDRYIALKILPAHYARDPKFIERFIREARTIARLEHKHILPVYDFGEEGGITYLAMRYLDGGTLKDVLALSRLTLADAAEIMSQVCSALDYAHRQDVVHRDVKPSNIMIDDEGAAYLTDFGIAKVLESADDLTGTGRLIGTPAYMSPEQVMGQPLDGRSDIYALGIILYEMVTGRVPYRAETPMATALAHVHEPLPLPHEIDPNVPEPIEAVVLKALAKEPGDRYQTANQLSAAFNQAVAEANVDLAQITLREVAVEARQVRASQIATYSTPVGPFTPPPPAEPTAPAWQRLWPLLVGGLALLIAVGVMIATLTGRVNMPEKTQESAAVRTKEPAEEATEKATEKPTEEAREGPTFTPTPDLLAAARLVKPCLGTQELCITDGYGQTVSRIDVSDAGFPNGLDRPSWSPDGTRIVFTACWESCAIVNDGDIYIVNVDGSGLVQLTSGGTNDLYPTWSPDGEVIAFHRNCAVNRIQPDGIGLLELAREPLCAQLMSWSPDGEWLAFVHDNPRNVYEPSSLWIVRRDGTDLQMLYEGIEWSSLGYPLWSPDGTYIVFELPGGDVVQLDTTCLELDRACDESDVSRYDGDWPMSWLPQYYPQWGGPAGEGIAQ